MKNYFKIYLKLSILIFGLPLLLTTCEKDSILLEPSQTEIEVESKYRVKTVKLSQIPKVKDFLIGKTNTNLFSRTTINGAIFDDDNILEVIDTLSNANYTFRFTYPDTQLGVFYNLVVGKTPEGENKTPYVLKYVCDDISLNSYVENNFDFQFFKGVVSLHKYTDFFEQGSILGKTTSIYTTETDTNCPPNYDENGDPIPCDTSNIDGSATIGGGIDEGDPSGGDNGSSISGGGESCSYQVYVTDCGGTNTDNLHLASSCGADEAGATHYYIWECGSPTANRVTTYSADTDDCPDCSIDSEGPVGILSEGMSAFVIAEILGFEEGSPEYMWLETHTAERIQIGNYLTENNNSPEAIAFAELAVDFLSVNLQFTFLQYENWFSSSYPDLTPIPFEIIPEDITYDISLTQQALPTFNSFLSNFPKLGISGNYSEMPTSQVYNLVGGSLLNSHLNQPTAYSNACSIRGSRGLLYSGIEIPVLLYNGSQRTQKGADGNNYVLDAISFNQFMIDKFGEATHKLEGVDANDPVKIANLLDGKNGIYAIINNSYLQAGYSGHVDTIINGICISNAYTMPPGGVKSIRIWELN